MRKGLYMWLGNETNIAALVYGCQSSLVSDMRKRAVPDTSLTQPTGASAGAIKSRVVDRATVYIPPGCQLIHSKTCHVGPI